MRKRKEKKALTLYINWMTVSTLYVPKPFSHCMIEGPSKIPDDCVLWGGTCDWGKSGRSCPRSLFDLFPFQIIQSGLGQQTQKIIDFEGALHFCWNNNMDIDFSHHCRSLSFILPRYSPLVQSPQSLQSSQCLKRSIQNMTTRLSQAHLG